MLIDTYTKISELTDADPLDGTETFPVVQSGTTKKISVRNNLSLTDDMLLYRDLGSVICAQGLGTATSSSSLIDGTIFWMAIHLPVARTLNGVKWLQIAQGNYTADNNNRIGLYSYSGGTLTQVAATTNNGDLWKATANTLPSEPFSATYSAPAGTYFVALLWNNVAVVSTPKIGATTTITSSGFQNLDFTNSAKVFGVLAGQTDLPSPTQAISGVANAAIQAFWVALY